MDIKIELEDQLHLLDLRQVEVVQSMITQVSSDLGELYQIQQQIAVTEQRKTKKKLHQAVVEPIPMETIDAARDESEVEWEKTLMGIKASVFNTTNTLKQLHDRRLALLQQWKTEQAAAQGDPVETEPEKE